MKEIIKYLLKYKAALYKIVLMSLVVVVLNTAIPAIYGRMLDLILKENIGNQLFMFLGIWLAIVLTVIFINRYLLRKKNDIAVRCDRDLVAEASAHFLRMPTSYQKDKKIGEVFDKIIRAGSNLRDIIVQVVFTSVPKLFAIVIILAIFISVNYKLVFIVLAIIALYCKVTLSQIRPLEMSEDEINRSYEDSNGDLQDSVSNVKVVKSFTAEKQEAEKFLKGNHKIYDMFLPMVDVWSNLVSIQNSILEVGFIVLIGASLIFLGRKEMTAGEVLMVIGYTRMLFDPLSNLSENYVIIKRGLVSIKGLEAFMQEKEEDYQGGIKLKNVKGKIEFKNVSFAYNGDQKILDNINLVVEEGDVIALVGRSGAGKTTLLELVSRLIDPTNGEILLDDQNIAEINIPWLREQIAVVLQDVELFNESIEDNIRYGNFNASHEDVVRAAKAANAHEFIIKLPNGYQQLIGDRGHKLSPGQRQRLSIARAILRNPKILILDEATSALDGITEREVQDALKLLVRGRTVFVIAHRLSTIREANKILVIEDGKIIQTGTHYELIADEDGSYYQFHFLQNS